MGEFSKPEGDLQQFNQDIGGGDNHGFVKIELTKTLDLKASAGYVLPLPKLIDQLKPHLPVWMQGIVSQFENKYVPQPEQSPAQEPQV